MAVAYVDTSYLVAIALDESGSARLARRLHTFNRLASANLLEAELRAVFTRERITPPLGLLASISWIIPERALHAEIERVLAAGYVRGGDCWHLATALYSAEDPTELHFLTLDDRQAAVAGALGFAE